MICGNSDILALIDYFQNGTDLSNNDWDNYNYYDLWNAIENGTTPPNRTVCGTFVQADIRSIVFAVLGVFTSPSDYLGDNIDFYYLYLKAIGQEVVSPKFSNFCIGQLYNVFSIGLTAKFRQPQDFNVTMSKVAAIASITFEQGQQLDALLSKSAALQQVVFQQQQTFNAELAAGFTGLLDDYPNAAAAYSVRLLSSTYSGPLVRIRKDTGGQPEKDFYPDSNNELSLNSGDGGGTTLGSWIGGNDGYIVTWYDQTENSLGLDLEQTSASAQPQIVISGSLNVLNSKPSLNFDGTNWMNTISLDVADGISQPWSLTHIGKSNTLTPQAFAGVWANQNLEARLLFDGNSPVNYFIQAGFNGTDGNIDTNQHVFNSIFDFPNSISKFYKDNSEETLSANIPANRAFRGFTLGAVNTGGTRPVDHEFQEVIIYPNELNDINGINTNINDFFNIYT